ncbi:UDP-glucose 4-epimerase [Opitutaceae bacterium TAV1]|nr:UDP-glucose 4-epimerase [Opitutaceae bacterium TAV1]
MRVLVTGGAGFIGTHTLEALRARGDDTALFDNFNATCPVAIKRANAALSGARVYEADLCDRAAVRAALRDFRPDAVIHLAARAGVRPSIEAPQLYIDSNITGTQHLLDECRAAGIGRIVVASSSSVYGDNTKLPFAEDDALLALASPYAVTKLAAEGLARIHAQLHGAAITVLRFFTVYGPRQRPDLAISKFVRAISAGKPVELYGDGSSSRDYTYVTDIVAGTLAALDRLQPGFRICNLGGDRPVTLAALVAAIEQAVGRKADIRRLPEQPGDVAHTRADLTRARALLGYAPAVTLAEGLARFREWHLAEGSRPPWSGCH